MDKKNLEDENIEELFRSMPDVKDLRSKDEILMKLKQDNRLNKTNTQRSRSSRKKRPSKWIPAFIALCAILLIGLLLPSMVKNSKNDSADSSREIFSTAEDKDEMQIETRTDNDNDATDSAAMGLEEASSNAIGNDFDNYYRAAYPSDVQDDTVFHVGLAGDAAASVPVTFIIPKDEIETAFNGNEPSSLDLYKRYASKIDEAALGFIDYHPYNGTFKSEGETISLTLPVNHGYDIASASMEVFLGTLQDTFYGFEAIEFLNEDGTPVEFDQVGEPSKPIKLNNGKDQANYYVTKQQNGEEYLSTNFRKSSKTLETALNDMKIKTNDIYTPVVPENVNFKISKENDYTAISFTDSLDLEKMEATAAQQMIDAILLTAASFDEQVVFENVVQTEWNGFIFDQPLPMPIGANYLPLEQK